MERTAEDSKSTAMLGAGAHGAVTAVPWAVTVTLLEKAEPLEPLL